MVLTADPRQNPQKAKSAEKEKVKKEKKPRSQKKGRGFFGRLLSWMISLGLLGGLGGMAVIAGALFYFGKSLPDYQALADYQPPIVTRAYASDGRLLAEFAAEKRVFVPVASVPDVVKHAFLSAEDKNFYTHPGIDMMGIARAMLNNIRNYGRGRLQGASTITQQVAKNFLLTNEKSLERKIKEAILAYRIEQAFTKDHILELYLNEIYLGARAYGVAAAALAYFGKALEDVTLEEAAFLAALPKAPNNYNPKRRYDAAFTRRNWVIDEMVDNGYVGPDEATAAKERPITLGARAEDEVVDYPYFAEDVRRKLVSLYGEKGLYEDGLLVKTTLMPEYQRYAEKALRKGLMAYDMRKGFHAESLAELDVDGEWSEDLGAVELPPGGAVFEKAVIISSTKTSATLGFIDDSRAIVTQEGIKWTGKTSVNKLLKKGTVWLFENTGKEKDGQQVYALRQVPKVQGGLIVMDAHTGRIYAMAGGFSFDMSQFNRASQAKRQPGSAFKPFVYLTALENGFTPATLVMDAPLVYDQGPGLEHWRPQNYSEEFYGPTTLRRGLEKSRNLMTVRLASYVGMDKVAEIAQRFGVMTNMPTYLSYALGAGETTLMRMVSGYSVFVNGGKQINPSLIDRIQNRYGKTIYVHEKTPCPGCGNMISWDEQAVPDVPDNRVQIADPRHMYQIVSMLEGVVQRGTGVLLKSLHRPVAGKTGTTNDAKDTWFIGFTPDLVMGVYVGFDVPKPLGKKETGSRVAAPIIKSFIEDALKDVPAVPFRVPRGVRLVQIDPENGTRAGFDDERTILEAFVEGTAPGDQPVMFDGQAITAVNAGSSGGEGVNTGLGGLY